MRTYDYSLSEMSDKNLFSKIMTLSKDSNKTPKRDEMHKKLEE